MNRYEDAARILRGLKDRVDDAEEERIPEGGVNVVRSQSESSRGVDDWSFPEYSLQFGDGDGATIDDLDSVFTGSSWTMSIFVKPDFGEDGTARTLFEWAPDGSNAVRIGMTSGDDWRVQVEDSTGSSTAVHTSGHSAGTIYHIAAVYDLSEEDLLFYWDTVQTGNTSMTREPSGEATAELAGGFTGDVDEIRLYDAVLDDEIDSLAVGEYVATNPVGRWTFDDADVPTVTDEAGSNDATVTGDPEWVAPLLWEQNNWVWGQSTWDFTQWSN